MSLQLGDVPESTDVLVIGSGFGGSVVADELARNGREVVVLERGKAYPPGAFPRTPAEFGENFWAPRDGLDGLFDVWSFRHINAIVSSGLGGGSLIYANVMVRKDPEWFSQPHPHLPGVEESWSFSYDDLESHYDAVEKFLDLQTIPVEIEVPKTTAFMAATPGAAQYAPLAVQFRNDVGRGVVGAPVPRMGQGAGVGITRDYRNIFGLPRRTCCMVGECDIGCNVGAKNSMDHTYLSSASAHGASIHVRTEVRTIEHRAGHFLVGYVVHRPISKGEKRPEPTVQYIRAQKVVLAAGSLGSTYLLLRAHQENHLPLNDDALGTRFCGNGDLLGFLLNSGRTLDATNGPVITAFASYPDNPQMGNAEYGMYIEDAGYPMFVNWLLQAPGVMGRFGWNAVKHRFSRGPDTSLSEDLGRILGNARLTNNALPLLGMGRDVPDGKYFLDPKDTTVMDNTWSIDSSRPYFEEMRQRMRGIADNLGGCFVVNPQYFLDRVITVHPLGGCPADTDKTRGVVDGFGRVHGVDGLWVCDGAAFPGPVGPNPSLTIAAFAHRAAETM